MPSNYGVVTPRAARDLGMRRKPRELVAVTQWVRTDGASPTWPKPSQQARSALHVHTQQWAYEAGGHARRQAAWDGAPKSISWWTQGYPSRAYRGESRRFLPAGRPQS